MSVTGSGGSLQITPENAEQIVRAGCPRWKIEKETLNTAKRLSYGEFLRPGKRYLSSVLGGLMFLALLIDQVQESSCLVFDEILKHYESPGNFMERLCAAFTTVKASDCEGFMRFGIDMGTLPLRYLPTDVGQIISLPTLNTLTSGLTHISPHLINHACSK